MSLQRTLRDLAEKLSEENYDYSFAQYRFWLEIGSTHGRLTVQDQVDGDTWQIVRSGTSKELINPAARLFVRFVGDIEADQTAPGSALSLHMRYCASALDRFFEENLDLVRSWNRNPTSFLTDVNLIAHWVNIGYVEEAVIHNHILQSLTSHPKLYDHQADALIILFKLAGATFEVLADPSAVDRSFELLKGHYSHDSVKGKLAQEVFNLRESDWKGLPPPPVFMTGEPNSAGADPAATPVITSLGLPSRDLESQIAHPPPFEPVFALEMDASPRSPAPHSPSISIASISDFTAADTFDDEPPLDSTAITAHGAFYFEDGNVEVLCDNTLFRVHTSVLSLHSPVLGRMFTKANLATAESPNGCPRILSSEAATYFTTLLKIIYLPTFPERNKVPGFTTFSSLLQITAKYEIPGVRSQMLDVVRDAYPEAFGGLAPSKLLGEKVFSGSTPHPNEVLNLFVQQNITSALPMAYYMAARRGLDSLMDRRLPAGARLSPEILQVAIKGLMALREMELKETHLLIFGSKVPRSCSLSDCPSRNTTGPRVSEAHQKLADRIVDSAHSGTRLLQVLSLREVCGGDRFGFCGSCVEGWEAGHADVRKKAWGTLSGVFGLNG